MNSSKKLFLRTSIVFLFLVIGNIFVTGCSGTSRFPLPPAEPFAQLDIQDGEYLDYRSIENGVDYIHYYWVTRIRPSGVGESIHDVYLDMRLTAEGKPEKDYTNWPLHFVIKNGILTECIGTVGPNDSDNFDSIGVKGVVYINYKLENEGVRYTYRRIIREKEKEVTTFMPFDIAYPSADMLWGFFFQMRYYDAQNGKKGVVGVTPHLIPNPMLVTWKKVGEETVSTEAGTFNTIVYKDFATDPFIDVASGMFIPNAGKMNYWFENNSRRLNVKMKTLVGEMSLVEVSNVLIRK